MGAGFTRRYNYVPGVPVLTLIEGIIILDLPPPGNIQGISSGVACLVGEFVDCTFGVAVDNNGNVTQSAQAVQIFTGQDMLNKVGGFDPTIGDFGGTMGNGFVELRNKSFAQLVVVPVSLASARATRMFRKLPFNATPTSPTPIVPMQQASVIAGTGFLSGSNQVNSAGPVNFTGFIAYLSGTDGIVAASAGATEAFNSAGGNFVQNGVAVGDAIVLGAPLTSALVSSPTGAPAITPTDAFVYLQAPGYTGYPVLGGLLQIDAEQMTYSGVTNGASGTAFIGLTRGANGTVGATHAAGAIAVGLNNVDTYRINAIPGATALTLERQSGANFSSSVSFGASAVPWRIHKSTDAESAAGIVANAGAYTVPARPLTALVAAAQVLSPVVAPPVATYNSWNPLSGLQMMTDPTTGLAFSANVQGQNPAANASLDALYANAIAVLQSQSPPAANVTLLWASRKSTNIRSALRTSVDNASGNGVGKCAVIAPDLQSVTGTSQAVASTDPGVGAVRDERVFYTWPAVQTFVPEAVNVNVKGADGKLYQNGIIDMPADGWLVAVLSNINPEWNPGQASAPVPAVLSPIAGLARNAPANLGINDYIALRQNGVCALRIDRSSGPVFQSGVTTSLTSGQTTIQRRRMADFCEDSIAVALAPLAKQPATLLWRDNVTTEIDSFANTLLSPDNPAQQRINAYNVDDVSGNTAALNQQGVFVWIVNIQTTPTADFIVLQFNVGNGVVISQQVR